MNNMPSQVFNTTVIAAVLALLLGYCNPAPAQGLRDPFSTTVAPARDPFYNAYPFQTPAQASRELDARTYRDRELNAITSSINDAARRSEDAADQREFQRRLEQIR